MQPASLKSPLSHYPWCLCEKGSRQNV